MKLEQLFPLFSESPDREQFVLEKSAQRARDLERKRLNEEFEEQENKKPKPRKRKTKKDEVQLSTEELALMNKLGLTKKQLLSLRKG